MPQVIRIVARWVFDGIIEEVSGDTEEAKRLQIWKEIFEECCDDFDFHSGEESSGERREEYALCVVEGYTRNRRLIRQFKANFERDEDA